ncbi:unnamed protein product [Aspergillus oryzae var. brunneus]|uniref:Unnamed protein product n=2 Tax=Aspergillus oryzae TaxID=5062 RepID=A0AAN5C0V1_ASPOZ|nr:unnamed protein product [Aspergillus oryzae]GMG53148.1 unnamed protein product [Aspergillus oryzae var. brunneus]
MRPLTLLPLLSNAYSQGQASITAEDSPDHPLGESEYNKVCANPSDNEVQVALGYFVRYYCDTYPQYWNDKIKNVPSIEACTLACSEIPGYKGALWKKKDATCWEAKEECLGKIEGLEKHAENLQKENDVLKTMLYCDLLTELTKIIETNRALTGTWGKMLYYPQQGMSIPKQANILEYAYLHTTSPSK